MSLRPDRWTPVLEADEDTRTALAGLVALAAINRGDSDLPEEGINDLTELAPDLIPGWVETINAWRMDQFLAHHPARQNHDFGKVGRNEPCPCGSGKKYKKCCGLN